MGLAGTVRMSRKRKRKRKRLGKRKEKPKGENCQSPLTLIQTVWKRLLPLANNQTKWVIDQAGGQNSGILRKFFSMDRDGVEV